MKMLIASIALVLFGVSENTSDNTFIVAMGAFTIISATVATVYSVECIKVRKQIAELQGRK